MGCGREGLVLRAVLPLGEFICTRVRTGVRGGGAVSEEGKKVLAAGINRKAFEGLVPVLRRKAFDVKWVATAEAGVKLAKDEQFDIIVSSAEPEEMTLELIVRSYRSSASRSRNAVIMVLAKPDRVDEARELKDRGVNRVMLVSDPPQIIGDQMASLLEVAPRSSVRLPMNLQASVGNKGRELFCQTVNLSTTGMLVRTTHKPQLGSIVVFQINIPNSNDPIIGRGEMVRHADKHQGGFDGVGVRFMSFAEDGAERLKHYVEELAVQAATADETEPSADPKPLTGAELLVGLGLDEEPDEDFELS